jgi:hypothetical protein
MTKSINIRDLKIEFTFRHKWEKNSIFTEFRKYDLGISFNKSKLVAKKRFNNPKEWGENLVNEYSIGINLLVIKFWVSICKGAMHFNL